MNTFLPYADFEQTAKVLDLTRLNTTINEALVLLRSIARVYEVKQRTGLSGFEGHTIAKFWKTHELALATYGLTLMQEMYNRPVAANKANRNEIFQKRKARLKQWKELVEYMEDQNWRFTLPSFIGNEDFHSGFRAFLLYKDIQTQTYRKWRSGGYPEHLVTRNLPPRKSSWKRQDYLNLWEFFGQPEPAWYGQFGWSEEPDDLKVFYSEDKIPQIAKEIQRKVDRPAYPFMRPR